MSYLNPLIAKEVLYWRHLLVHQIMLRFSGQNEWYGVSVAHDNDDPLFWDPVLLIIPPEVDFGLTGYKMRLRFDGRSDWFGVGEVR